jgi:hypothetical protein
MITVVSSLEKLEERDGLTRDRDEPALRRNGVTFRGERQRRNTDQILAMTTRDEQPVDAGEVDAGTIDQMHTHTLRPAPIQEGFFFGTNTGR